MQVAQGTLDRFDEDLEHSPWWQVDEVRLVQLWGGHQPHMVRSTISSYSRVRQCGMGPGSVLFESLECSEVHTSPHSQTGGAQFRVPKLRTSGHLVRVCGFQRNAWHPLALRHLSQVSMDPSLNMWMAPVKSSGKIPAERLISYGRKLPLEVSDHEARSHHAAHLILRLRRRFGSSRR